MEGADRMDDRTFRVNFSGDGAARLRERVKEKLKEFMGDYTDDTLVVCVLCMLLMFVNHCMVSSSVCVGKVIYFDSLSWYLVIVLKNLGPYF